MIELNIKHRFPISAQQQDSRANEIYVSDGAITFFSSSSTFFFLLGRARPLLGPALHRRLSGEAQRLDFLSSQHRRQGSLKTHRCWLYTEPCLSFILDQYLPGVECALDLLCCLVGSRSVSRVKKKTRREKLVLQAILVYSLSLSLSRFFFFGEHLIGIPRLDAPSYPWNRSYCHYASAFHIFKSSFCLPRSVFETAR